MRFVFYARPHLFPLPQEKEQLLRVSVLSAVRPANPGAQFLRGRRTILLRLMEICHME